jgi:hypothetical protein
MWCKFTPITHHGQGNVAPATEFKSKGIDDFEGEAYNGDAHDGLGGRTPLEAMKFFLERRDEDLRRLAWSPRSAEKVPHVAAPL